MGDFPRSENKGTWWRHRTVVYYSSFAITAITWEMRDQISGCRRRRSGLEISRKLNRCTSAALKKYWTKKFIPVLYCQQCCNRYTKYPWLYCLVSIFQNFIKFVTKIKLVMVVYVIIQLALGNHNLCIITYLFVRLLFNQWWTEYWKRWGSTQTREGANKLFGLDDKNNSHHDLIGIRHFFECCSILMRLKRLCGMFLGQVLTETARWKRLCSRFTEQLGQRLLEQIETLIANGRGGLIIDNVNTTRWYFTMNDVVFGCIHPDSVRSQRWTLGCRRVLCWFLGTLGGCATGRGRLTASGIKLVRIILSDSSALPFLRLCSRYSRFISAFFRFLCWTNRVTFTLETKWITVKLPPPLLYRLYLLLLHRRCRSSSFVASQELV